LIAGGHDRKAVARYTVRTAMAFYLLAQNRLSIEHTVFVQNIHAAVWSDFDQLKRHLTLL